MRAPLPSLVLLLSASACAPDDSDMQGPWDGACTVETAEGETFNAFTLQVDTEGAGSLDGSGIVAWAGAIYEGPLSGQLSDGQASIDVDADVAGSTLELQLDGDVVADTFSGTCSLQTFEGTFEATVGG